MRAVHDARYKRGASSAGRCRPGDPHPQCTTHTSNGKGEGDHVNISPEHDTPPRDSARGPWPGSETSWRGAPHCAVTGQLLGWVLVGSILLVCLGLLLGATWTTQILQPKLRHQAEERRKLNAEWLAVRTARQQRGECPRCASPLSEKDWYTPTLVEDPPDED
jgi:hypothetical protein